MSPSRQAGIPQILIVAGLLSAGSGPAGLAILGSSGQLRPGHLPAGAVQLTACSALHSDISAVSSAAGACRAAALAGHHLSHLDTADPSRHLSAANGHRHLALALIEYGYSRAVLCTNVLMPQISNDYSKLFMKKNFWQCLGDETSSFSLGVAWTVLLQPVLLLKELVAPLRQTLLKMLCHRLQFLLIP